MPSKQSKQRSGLRKQLKMPPLTGGKSAELILKFSDILETSRYAKIVTDIESHGSNYALLPRTKKG